MKEPEFEPGQTNYRASVGFMGLDLSYRGQRFLDLIIHWGDCYYSSEVCFVGIHEGGFIGSAHSKPCSFFRGLKGHAVGAKVFVVFPEQGMKL